jgi:hypothetical protein
MNRRAFLMLSLLTAASGFVLGRALNAFAGVGSASATRSAMSPCGTSATWSLVRLGDAIGGIADIARPRGIGRK